MSSEKIAAVASTGGRFRTCWSRSAVTWLRAGGPEKMLLRMDARFVARLERAINAGREHRPRCAGAGAIRLFARG